MYARQITDENSVDDPYPELLDARELGDGDGGRVAASHGAHLDVHLEVALDSERKMVWDKGFYPFGTVDTQLFHQSERTPVTRRRTLLSESSEEEHCQVRNSGPE